MTRNEEATAAARQNDNQNALEEPEEDHVRPRDQQDFFNQHMLESVHGHDGSESYGRGMKTPVPESHLDATRRKDAFLAEAPPGISHAVVPNPVFSLTPAVTVDEGNNWIKVYWGTVIADEPSDPWGRTETTTAGRNHGAARDQLDGCATVAAASRAVLANSQ